jgi:hypothetical protein
MRKKYFVLLGPDRSNPARLEYYDSYKKWSTAQLPKRSIVLEDCFKICRRIDTKNKFCIGLYLQDCTFSLACDNEDTLQDWLQHLLEAKYGDEVEPNNG